MSADENVVATSEVYWPVSGRLNTPPGRRFHTLCFLIISNSNISCFSRITSQLYNGRVNFRTHQNITFYFLQLIHIERLINTSTSGYQKTKIIHCLKIFLIRIKNGIFFSSAPHLTLVNFYLVFGCLVIKFHYC